MPYIYLIKAHNSGGLHKIGKTIDINRRMRELKAAPSDQVEIIKLPSETLMNAAEKLLHRQFEATRVPQSEMFNLSPEQVTVCRQAMKEVEAKYAEPPLTPEQLAAREKACAEVIARREALRRQAIQAKKEETRRAHEAFREEQKLKEAQSEGCMKFLVLINCTFVGALLIYGFAGLRSGWLLTAALATTAGAPVAVGFASKKLVRNEYHRKDRFKGQL